MAEVRPFRALRYDPAAVEELSRVLCPPYDVISPQDREELCRRSPFNVVRLEFGRPEPGDDGAANVYTRAAALLRRWQEQGVVGQDRAPAYYLTSEEYQSAFRGRRRVGLFAAVRLEEYARRVILPHEQTRPGPKEDRLRLMQACHAVFSPIMALYRDPGGLRPLLQHLMGQGPPEVAASEGPIRYGLWALRDADAVQEVRQAFAPLPLYLVDGHHRYETALTYRDARRSQAQAHPPAAPAYDFALACLIDLQDSGFQLLSFHRLIHGLEPGQLQALWQRTRELFDVQQVRRSPGTSEPVLGEFLRELEALAPEAPTFGMVDAATGWLYRLTLRSDLPVGAIPPAATPQLRECEIWLLHRALLEPIVGAAAEEPPRSLFCTTWARWPGRCSRGPASWSFWCGR
jgi:uncharacterized protein (DUF1015 family)